MKAQVTHSYAVSSYPGPELEAPGKDAVVARNGFPKCDTSIVERLREATHEV